MRRTSVLLAGLLPLATIALTSGAQEQGASRLDFLVRGLTVTPRVLVIGTRPSDENTPLLTWLSRGHAVQTAYLSLTRGESQENFLGEDLGSGLGVVHRLEALEAHGLDGVELFYTRAMDVGFARNSTEAFRSWDRAALVRDIIAVIRSFRPQVVVLGVSPAIPNHPDGLRDATEELARAAFDSAGDIVDFDPSRFGWGWQPAKLYVEGPGLSITTDVYDSILGRTYDDVARDVRAHTRASGVDLASGRVHHSYLKLVSPVLADSGAVEHSIFDNVDTTFARLALASPPQSDDLRSLMIAADSAHGMLDLRRPEAITRYLAAVVDVGSRLRARTAGCGHPSAFAGIRGLAVAKCAQPQMDLDASIDLIMRRATAALLAASGVVITATADREVVAPGNEAAVTVTLANRGHQPVTLSDVLVASTPHSVMGATIVNPGQSWRVVRMVPGDAIPYSRPAWITDRKLGMFGPLLWPIDGVARPDSLQVVVPSVMSVAIPEQLRRTIDVTAIVSVGGVTFAAGLGAPTYAYVDPTVGVQPRDLRSAPPVTLSFDRSLEWIRAGRPIDHRLQLTAKSYSDSVQIFHFKLLTPRNVRVDSLPASVTLAPHEERSIFLHLSGMLDSGRYEFGVIGEFKNGGHFAEGMRTTHYTHVPPAEIFHGSGLWLQAVKIEIPKQLTAAYISGAGEEIGIPAALRQIGVSLLTLSVDEFPMLDLSRFTTIVVGPRAYDLYPDLLAQNGRLFDFVRKGGTLVVLGQQSSISQALPLPVRPAMPFPVHVTFDAPVVPVDPHSRLLRTPNTIGDDDWSGWIQDRADAMPLTADPKYTTVIETHDAGEPPNRNAILTTQLGKGTYVYTTLTFYRQVAGGIPGSLRLLVNLLGAGTR